MRFGSNETCLFLVMLETLLFNGIFSGWSVICDMFKEDEMFLDFCDKLVRVFSPFTVRSFAQSIPV